MEKENGKNLEINVKELFSIMLKKLWITVVVAAIFFGATYWYSTNKVTPLYTSKCQVIVISNNAAYTSQSVVMDDNFSKNYVYIIKTNKTILRNALVQYNETEEVPLDLTPEQLASMMGVSSPAETQIIEISITHPDPVTAKKLSKYICVEARKYITESVAGTDNISVIDPDPNPPVNPSSPNTMSDSVTAGLVGFILANALIAVIHFLNDAVVSKEDVENYLDLKVIGAIPHSQSFAQKSSVSLSHKRKTHRN